MSNRLAAPKNAGTAGDAEGSPQGAHEAMPASSTTTLLRAAQAAGLVPADARPPSDDTRPWPVTLLTAFGAWLAAIPLLGVVGSLLGGALFDSGIGPYLAGALLVAAALVVLRSHSVSVFVEQLAVPLLLAGAGALGLGLFRDLPHQPAAGLLGAMVIGCAAAVQRPWLRTLAGTAAALLCMVALVPDPDGFGHAAGFALTFWLAPHGALAAWLGSLVWQQHRLGSATGARDALLVEQAGTGWLVAVVATLAWQSGATFLLGGAVPGITRDLSGLVLQEGTGADLVRGLTATLSVLLTLAGALRIARAWPAMRQPPAAIGALVLAAFAALLPSLGAVVLALATCATSRRWRLAAACGVAAGWILGSSYYQVAWPLASKAVALLATGVALGGLAWWAHRRTGTTHAAPHSAAMAPRPARRSAMLLLAVTGLAVLAVANIGIRQKETLIAHGQPIFVPLAPVDPRSLMQGDYMRLRFALPEPADDIGSSLHTSARPQVVARRDARGVATLLRMQRPGDTLAPDEIAIDLRPKDGGWILVSDGLYFREGEAARFAQARFGEFRVAPDGSALLVGMADAQLQRIAP